MTAVANNLEESLSWLQENLSQAHLAGFTFSRSRACAPAETQRYAIRYAINSVALKFFKFQDIAIKFCFSQQVRKKTMRFRFIFMSLGLQG